MTVGQQIQIDELRKEIQDLKDDKLIEPFVRLMLERIGVELANMPFDEWPNIARIAYQYSARETPNSANLYYVRLPDNG